MNAASLDRLRTAGALQACTRRVAKAALEYEMACDACQGLALEVAAWCREKDACAGQVPAFTTMKRRIEDARAFARGLCRGASCIADAVTHETLVAMTPDEREAFGDAVIRVMSRDAFDRLDFSFCLQFFPTSGSFPMSRLFTSGGQSIRASVSASVLLMNI